MNDADERAPFDIFLIIETKLQHAITQMRNPEPFINPNPNRGSSAQPLHIFNQTSLLPESSRHFSSSPNWAQNASFLRIRT
jgi:hypothetical protein